MRVYSPAAPGAAGGAGFSAAGGVLLAGGKVSMDAPPKTRVNSPAGVPKAFGGDGRETSGFSGLKPSPGGGGDSNNRVLAAAGASGRPLPPNTRVNSPFASVLFGIGGTGAVDADWKNRVNSPGAD